MILFLFCAYAAWGALRLTDKNSGIVWNLRGIDQKLRALQTSLINHPGGRLICKKGNVEIEETRVRGEDTRTMLFANEESAAVEAVVVCEGYGNCESDCTPCPCKAKMNGPSRLGTNYHRTIAEQLSSLCGQSSRVLLVGLGGSVLTQYLADNCPSMKIDVFEIDADVVSAAQGFFGLGECKTRNPGRIGVSTVDAAVGLSKLSDGGGAGLELADGFEKGADAYDSVVIDCFVGQGKIPDACRSRNTLEMVRGVLKPGGYLLQNAWGRSLQLDVVAQDFMQLEVDYRGVFSQFEDLHVPMPASVDFVHILKGTK